VSAAASSFVRDVVLLALQYYVPLRSRMGGGLKKNLSKSFLLFIDNPRLLALPLPI
jgi:hypothetical protein